MPQKLQLKLPIKVNANQRVYVCVIPKNDRSKNQLLELKPHNEIYVLEVGNCENYRYLIAFAKETIIPLFFESFFEPRTIMITENKLDTFGFKENLYNVNRCAIVQTIYLIKVKVIKTSINFENMMVECDDNSFCVLQNLDDPAFNHAHLRCTSKMNHISIQYLPNTSYAMKIVLFNEHSRNLSFFMCDDDQSFGHSILPLVANDELDPIGSIHIEYNAIKPVPFCQKELMLLEPIYQHLPMYQLEVGHRGMGSSFRVAKPSKILENTIFAFRSAFDQGLRFVEFDVQVSKDLKPLIYHDFSVVTCLENNENALIPNEKINGEIQSPSTYKLMGIHQLTHKELISLKLYHETLLDYSGKELEIMKGEKLLPNANQKLIRDLTYNGNSTDVEVLEPVYNHEEIIDDTSKDNNNTNNELTKAIESEFCAFPSLRAVLDELPEQLGYNVEFKYPMPYEDGTHESLDGNYIEMNLYCDLILKEIFRSDQRPENINRPLIFSSFHPDICLMLSLKQHRYPVMLCFDICKDLHQNDLKTTYFIDSRTHNLKHAINFCAANSLAGLSIKSKTLLMDPEIVETCKDHNLKLLVWGSETSDETCRASLLKMGVNGIIYDKIS